MDQYYYVFGFLFLVYVILGVTCAEITIVLNYFQLCSEGKNSIIEDGRGEERIGEEKKGWKRRRKDRRGAREEKKG